MSGPAIAGSDFFSAMGGGVGTGFGVGAGIGGGSGSARAGSRIWLTPKKSGLVEKGFGEAALGTASDGSRGLANEVVAPNVFCGRGIVMIGGGTGVGAGSGGGAGASI